MPFLKIGLGRSSRGSRSGRPRASRMSWSVSSPTPSSLASSADVDLGELGAAARGAARLSRTTSGVEAELLQQPGRDRVAFGVDPGAVERVARPRGS